MLDHLIYLLFVALGLTLFFGTVPLIIAVKLGDRSRIERLLDLYTEVFAASAASVIRILKGPSELPRKKIRSPPDGHEQPHSADKP
jgi:hypothetical protein